MPEKADGPESKKECPSCGLGVPADATICEFCGWNFEEEDEWVVQIEKLERDLMHEKQKFKPGTVDHMIETTLRTLGPEATEASSSKGSDGQQAAGPAEAEPARTEADEARESSVRADTAVAEEDEARTPPAEEAPATDVGTASQAHPSQAPRVRRVRTVKATPSGQPARAAKEAPGTDVEKKGLLSSLLPPKAKEQAQEGQSGKRTRTVRKVKE
jgi:hypothetical protein